MHANQLTHGQRFRVLSCNLQSAVISHGLNWEYSVFCTTEPLRGQSNSDANQYKHSHWLQWALDWHIKHLFVYPPELSIGHEVYILCNKNHFSGRRIRHTITLKHFITANIELGFSDHYYAKLYTVILQVIIHYNFTDFESIKDFVSCLCITVSLRKLYERNVIEHIKQH